jgi:hypothetical protein
MSFPQDDEVNQPRVADIEDFIEEALTIVEIAEREKIVLRIMGSIAIKLHCGEHAHIHDALNREITDIDFMTSVRNRGKLKPFLASLGLTPNERFNYFHGTSRHIYLDSRNRTVDIFFD